MSSDASKLGRDWGDDELDVIVADYFAMLGDELANRPYVKRRRGLALQERLGRTHASIEFKHMNISAVLAELALPTITGYRPMANYQRSILDAIDRYLTRTPSALRPEASPVADGFAEPLQPFFEPPPLLGARAERPADLERIVRKFDPVERDFRNRTLGQAGEDLIVAAERSRLVLEGRGDLARKVRWVAQEDGDGAGYDIRSFASNGDERLLEVKTTNGGKTTPFFLTRNEKALSDERPDAFRIVRVFEFVKTPRVFELQPPLERCVLLEGESWRASFGA